MPQSAPHRRSLPLLGQLGGGRSRQTCRFRCGDACFHDAPNTSDNTYFGEVAATALSRRNMLRAGAVGAGATAAAAGLGGLAPALADNHRGRGNPRLRFEGLQPGTSDAVEIPDGYEQRVVVRWGDPVLPDAPEFDFTAQTAEAQAKQFGYNCDFVGFQPLGRDRGLLWVNHEYTNEALMFEGYTDGNDADPEQIRIAMAAHGGSVVEIRREFEGRGRGRGRRTGGWRLSRGRRRFNRRITASTPMELTGPAAGDELLRTEADSEGIRVLGMLNNCAGGTTPWGTILTCEENYNQYFVGGEDVPEEAKPALARYGIATESDTRADNRRFDRVDERFDLSRHPNEANRFGYVVEIDPYDPDSTPKKHTMLGRIKHEGANIRITRDGRVAVYMGDDERFDYIYKFVSERRYRRGSRRGNSRVLESGTLYVAKLRGDSPEKEFDGSGKLPSDGAFDGWGEWIPLASHKESFVEGFTVAEVLVHTRLAADKAGATKMDRPEDIEASPVTGKIYCALTNNSAREPGQADEPNPRGPNRYGHILEITERHNDAAATRFRWDVPIVCGDPEDPATYFAGFDKSEVTAVSSPDNLTFDGHGNLWISTDGMAWGNDGLFAVPVEGRHKGHLTMFARVPNGAECCGPLITEDQKTVFIAPQHPGDGGSYEEPQSTWPDREGFPRPSVVSIWHGRGKDIGS
ncbi:PhoX family protein [Streptomonospora halophila]|uniref:PhoX family protein n=1 Tax=Streptomonospora halophila TaxID=427369 RepID=A0ABP9GIG2_9ACTN